MKKMALYSSVFPGLGLAAAPKSQLSPSSLLSLPKSLLLGLPHGTCSSLVSPYEDSFPAFFGKFLCFSKFQILRKICWKIRKTEKNSIILLQDLSSAWNTQIYWCEGIHWSPMELESRKHWHTESKVKVIVLEIRMDTCRRNAIKI